jgi:hypothetical protein
MDDTNPSLAAIQSSVSAHPLIFQDDDFLNEKDVLSSRSLEELKEDKVIDEPLKQRRATNNNAIPKGRRSRPTSRSAVRELKADAQPVPMYSNKVDASVSNFRLDASVDEVNIIRHSVMLT